MKRVVITGLGAVTALGQGVETFWQRLIAGSSGLRPMERLDPAGLRNPLAGEVPGASALLVDGDRSHGPGFVRSAVQEALRQARLADVEAAVLATNFGGQHAWWEGGEPTRRLAELDFHAAAGWAEATGLTVTLSNACSSGTHAVGHAADLVRLGQAETAVACGFDELGLFCLSGLSILHTISTDTIRPFDARRSGTIFGEGAAALVVESLDHAEARGALPLAEVLGYGVNNNAWHMTAPDKDGEGMVNAVRMALAQASLAPERVGHVNAHATGTEYHDPAEAAALRTVFGDRAEAMPVSAIKAATGHAMGAAGAIEAVATVLALAEQVCPPTLNCDEVDPACAVDVVRGAARPASFEVALSISAGLGGNNAALLLGRL